MTKAAIYCRVSTDIQAEKGTSLDSQEAACRAHAEQHGYTIVDTVRESHSGADLWDRRGLSDLRAQMRAGAFDVLVAYAVDRLSREQNHIGILLDEAARHRVRLEFVTERFEATAVGKFLLQAQAFAAELEREKIRERSLRGKRARVESGRVYGFGVDLFGYTRDRAVGVRLVNETEAAIVRQIFHWVAEEGQTVRGVAARLNAAGIAPPSAGRITYEAGRTPRWGKTQVHRLLTEPAYKGEPYAWRRQRLDKKRLLQRDRSEWIALPPETTPALVTPAVWQAAGERLAMARGDGVRNTTRPYLLRGFIFCARCGARMYSEPEKGRRVYRCSSRDTVAGKCGGKRTPAAEVEQWAWEKVEAILHDPSIITAEIERRRREGADQQIIADRDAVARRLARLEAQQSQMLRRFRERGDEPFPWELVEREISAAEKEKLALRAELDTLDARIGQHQASLDQLAAFRLYCERVAEELAGFDFERRRLAFTALGVAVNANGTDPAGWWMHASTPLDLPVEVGALSHSSAGSGHAAGRLHWVFGGEGSIHAPEVMGASNLLRIRDTAHMF